MKTRWVVCLVTIMMLMLSAISVYASTPQIPTPAPQSFYGSITSSPGGVTELGLTASPKTTFNEGATLAVSYAEGTPTPTLENGSVNPSYGDTSTTFTYSVTYKDPSGYAPTIKYVCIDGSNQTMAKVSGDYTSGAIFQYETSLPAGSHDYYFYFEDYQGLASRLPASGAYSDPTVEFARIGASYTSTPPLFDGILGAEGEDWGDAVITKTLKYMNTLTGKDETHEMTVYARYGGDNLYIAIKITNDDYSSNIAEAHDRIWIFFDNDNDSVIEENEDVHSFYNQFYEDCHFKGEEYWTWDYKQDGGGCANFVSPVPGALGDWIYEFEIPLNSEDVHDLSITPGSTVGIMIEYAELHYYVDEGSFRYVGADGWPSYGKQLNGLAYAKLRLGVTARFTSDVRSGTAPLTIKFTEQCQGDPATSYAWDFNNDGIIDSTGLNPSYTYTDPGTYTVSLMVTGREGPDTATKEGYIKVSGADILPYYRSYSGDPNVVDTEDLLKAANDWGADIAPPGFTEPITTEQLLQLADEWVPQPLQATIEEIKGDITGYINIPVRVEGFFGQPGAPYLITDYDYLLINTPLPENSYLILTGNIPPEEYEGNYIEIWGTIEVYNEQYPSYIFSERVVLNVSDYTMASGGNWESKFLGETTTGARSGSVRHFPDIMAGFQAATKSVPPVALLISGGGNHNHDRFWNDLTFMYDTLKNDYGFTDDNIYVLYWDGKDLNGSGSITDYAATKSNLLNVFGILADRLAEIGPLFVFVTNHGMGYHSTDGYKGGIIDFPGDEGQEIKESAFKIDGSQLGKDKGYWKDFDGDGIKDDVLYRGSDGVVKMYVNGDPDGNTWIDNWDVDGEDTNKDGIIDSTDGGVDLNDDGDKNDWVGIDEVVNLYGDEVISDDEFWYELAVLSPPGCPTMVVVMEQCFSGGFVNDLSLYVPDAPRDRVLMFATEEDAYSYGTLNYDHFVYHFTSALHKATPDGTSVNADANKDGKISMQEAFNHAEKNDYVEFPQYDDNGDKVSHTGQMPKGGDGSLGAKTFLDP